MGTPPGPGTPSPAAGYRMGIDVRGTFTDFIPLLEPGTERARVPDAAHRSRSSRSFCRLVNAREEEEQP